MAKHKTGSMVFIMILILISGCATGTPPVVGNVLGATPTQPISPTSSGVIAVTPATGSATLNPAGFTTPATVQPTDAPLTNQNPASFTTPGAPIPTSVGFAPTPQPITPTPGAPVTPTLGATVAPTTGASGAPVMPTTAAGTTGGSAEAGKAVFTGVGACNACHDVTAGIQIVGPSLKGVASRAGSREPGLSAEDYLRESILTPNKFIVPGFIPNIMPQTFTDRLSAQQINDVIAYLMTLK